MFSVAKVAEYDCLELFQTNSIKILRLLSQDVAKSDIFVQFLFGVCVCDFLYVWILYMFLLDVV
jgi:hypothetical protein